MTPQLPTTHKSKDRAHAKHIYQFRVLVLIASSSRHRPHGFEAQLATSRGRGIDRVGEDVNPTGFRRINHIT